MTADETTLTPASVTALAHYRKRAIECRKDAAVYDVLTGDLAHCQTRAEECRTDAAAWDALADELAAFGETTGEHDDQGALL